MSDPFLQELRERFRETSAQRLVEMSALLDGVLDADVVHRLARHFHAFAGLGTTYGFRRISELGDEGEASLLPLVRTGELPSEPTVARWRELCVSVAEALSGGEMITLSPTPAVERRRILAVDDDATQRVLIAHVLETAGYEVMTCADVEHFDEIFQAFAADLLLVDMQLGDCDRGGAMLVERVRALEHHRALPVIFVSADRETEPGSTDPHLLKPVDWTALLALIRSVLQGPPLCGPPDAFSKTSPTPTADD